MTAFQPDPRDDDATRADAPADDVAATDEVASGVVASACPLCGTLVQPNDLRCPSCNMTLAGIGGRPGPFSRRVLWAWALALLAIYLIVLVVIAVVPS